MTEIKHTTELIPFVSATIQHRNINAVDARILHEFLQVKTEFNHWITRRIDSYGFVQGIDFVVVTFDDGPITTKEYHVTINMAKELAMVERTRKGKEARQYFLACEEIALEKQKVQPVTPALPAITMDYIRDYASMLKELGQFNDRDAMMISDVMRTQFQKASGLLTVSANALPSPASFDAEDILREVAPSLDGTQVRRLTGTIGKVLADGWREFHPGEYFTKSSRWIDGKQREVNCYPMQEMAWARPLVHAYLCDYVPYFKD